MVSRSLGVVSGWVRDLNEMKQSLTVRYEKGRSNDDKWSVGGRARGHRPYQRYLEIAELWL
ncbi:MAG: hypothetical protein HC942_30410 [Microcoleus sp. SU_5_6]|nr:hypothetical protein [Microcoleus sp. SU_5_6]NJS10747.1 hypothetical protein [Microcoleus sp. CSU_2_2]